jgi:simple sugar transport system substrate-binding protein
MRWCFVAATARDGKIQDRADRRRIREVSMQKHHLRALILAAGLSGGGLWAAAAQAENVKIGFITKFPAEFFAVLENGGKAYAAANPGVDIVFGQAKSATDAEGEIAIIESMIAQGVKGIAITPINASVSPALDKAVQAGIKVVLMDNDLPDWKGKTAVVATDNLKGGQLAGKWLSAKLKSGDKVALLEGVPGVPALDARITGMLDGLGAVKIKIAGKVTTKCQLEAGVSGTEDLLTANPDIVAVYSACGAPALGAIQAIENAKIAPGKIIVVGFDGLGDEFAAIQKGTEAATIVQFPAKIGELGVKTVVAAVRGEKVEPFVDTGTDVATKDNLAKFK